MEAVLGFLKKFPPAGAGVRTKSTQRSSQSGGSGNNTQRNNNNNTSGSGDGSGSNNKRTSETQAALGSALCVRDVEIMSSQGLRAGGHRTVDWSVKHS